MAGFAFSNMNAPVDLGPYRAQAGTMEKNNNITCYQELELVMSPESVYFAPLLVLSSILVFVIAADTGFLIYLTGKIFPELRSLVSKDPVNLHKACCHFIDVVKLNIFNHLVIVTASIPLILLNVPDWDPVRKLAVVIAFQTFVLIKSGALVTGVAGEFRSVMFTCWFTSALAPTLLICIMYQVMGYEDDCTDPIKTVLFLLILTSIVLDAIVFYKSVLSFRLFGKGFKTKVEQCSDSARLNCDRLLPLLRKLKTKRTESSDTESLDSLIV